VWCDVWCLRTQAYTMQAVQRRLTTPVPHSIRLPPPGRLLRTKVPCDTENVSAGASSGNGILASVSGVCGRTYQTLARRRASRQPSKRHAPPARRTDARSVSAFAMFLASRLCVWRVSRYQVSQPYGVSRVILLARPALAGGFEACAASPRRTQSPLRRGFPGPDQERTSG